MTTGDSAGISVLDPQRRTFVPNTVASITYQMIEIDPNAADEAERTGEEMRRGSRRHRRTGRSEGRRPVWPRPSLYACWEDGGGPGGSVTFSRKDALPGERREG